MGNELDNSVTSSSGSCALSHRAVIEGEPGEVQLPEGEAHGVEDLGEISEQLSRIFREEILQPVNNPPNSPDFFADDSSVPQDPIQIDGRIDIFEEWHLWITVLIGVMEFHIAAFAENDEIIEHVEDLKERAQWPTIESSPPEFVQELVELEQQAAKLNPVLINFNDNNWGELLPVLQKSVVESTEIQPAELEAIQSILLDYKACDSPNMGAFIDYVLLEIQVALENESALKVYGPLDEMIPRMLPDRGENEDFRKFLNQNTPLSGDIFDSLSGRPIDWIDAGREAPTLIVYLDEHTDDQAQRGMLADWAQLHSLDPFYGHESFSYNEPVSDRLFSYYFGESGIPFWTLSLNPFPSRRRRSIRRFEQTLRLIDDTCRRGDFKEKQFAVNILPEIYSLFPEYATMKSGITDLEDDDFRHFLLRDGNACLYRGGIEMVGYEDEDVKKVARFYRKKEDKSAEEHLLNALLLMYRSQLAYEKTLLLMGEEDEDVGVIRMGMGHYATLKKQAATQQKANVIFVVAEPYDGPMPELGKRHLLNYKTLPNY